MYRNLKPGPDISDQLHLSSRNHHQEVTRTPNINLRLANKLTQTSSQKILRYQKQDSKSSQRQHSRDIHHKGRPATPGTLEDADKAILRLPSGTKGPYEYL